MVGTLRRHLVKGLLKAGLPPTLDGSGSSELCLAQSCQSPGSLFQLLTLSWRRISSLCPIKAFPVIAGDCFPLFFHCASLRKRGSVSSLNAFKWKYSNLDAQPSFLQSEQNPDPLTSPLPACTPTPNHLGSLSMASPACQSLFPGPAGPKRRLSG